MCEIQNNDRITSVILLMIYIPVVPRSRNVHWLIEVECLAWCRVWSGAGHGVRTLNLYVAIHLLLQLPIINLPSTITRVTTRSSSCRCRCILFLCKIRCHQQMWLYLRSIAKIRIARGFQTCRIDREVWVPSDLVCLDLLVREFQL